MDKYLGNLIDKLKCGKLSSDQLLVEVERSNVDSFFDDGMMLSVIAGNSNPHSRKLNEILGDNGFKELCTQADFLLNGTAMLFRGSNQDESGVNHRVSLLNLQQPMMVDSFSMLSEVTTQRSSRNQPMPEEFEPRYTTEDHEENFNPIRKPLTDMTTPNGKSASRVRSPISKGKKQYTDEEIEVIRLRTLSKQADKVNSIRKQNYIKEIEEFNEHCSFKPQVNSRKNIGVKPKFMDLSTNKSHTKTPQAQHGKENIAFTPQTTKYPTVQKSNSKKLDDLCLDSCAVSNLSNSPSAKFLSTRYGSTATISSDTILQQVGSFGSTPHVSPKSHFIVNQPQSYFQSNRLAESVNAKKDPSTIRSQIQSLLVDQYGVSIEKNCEQLIEQLVATLNEKDQIKEPKVEQPNDTGLSAAVSAALLDDPSSIVLESVEEVASSQGENTKVTTEQDTRSHKKKQASVSKGSFVSSDFITRQYDFQKNRQNRISQMSLSLSPDYKPQLNVKSQEILQKNPKFQDSVSRSQHFESLKQKKLESLKHETAASFHPTITKFAKSISKTVLKDLHKSSQLRSQEKIQAARAQKNRKELEELIFHPEINANIITESKLGLNKKTSEYIQDLRAKQELKKEYKQAVEKRKELKEAIECTYQPRINEHPHYLSNINKSIDCSSEYVGVEPARYLTLNKKPRNKELNSSSQSSLSLSKNSKDHMTSRITHNDPEVQSFFADYSIKKYSMLEYRESKDNTLTIMSDLWSMSNYIEKEEEQVSQGERDPRMKLDMDKLQFSVVYSAQETNDTLKKTDGECLTTKTDREELTARGQESNFNANILSPMQNSGKKPPRARAQPKPFQYCGF